MNNVDELCQMPVRAIGYDWASPFLTTCFRFVEMVVRESTDLVCVKNEIREH